jgi:hypothetical protein
MRSFLLCALILTSCAAPRRPESTEAIAEAKQQALVQQNKGKEKYNQTVRLAVRRVYLQDHPQLASDIRKAILNEKLEKGMSVWDVIAAYSMWEYADPSSAAKYRGIGAEPLWTLMDRRVTTAGQIQNEEWTLQRKKAVQYLHFENGILTKWDD